MALRGSLSFFQSMADSDENLDLGYFDYADSKNFISFALGRRILELAIFA